MNTLDLNLCLNQQRCNLIFGLTKYPLIREETKTRMHTRHKLCFMYLSLVFSFFVFKCFHFLHLLIYFLVNAFYGLNCVSPKKCDIKTCVALLSLLIFAQWHLLFSSNAAGSLNSKSSLWTNKMIKYSTKLNRVKWVHCGKEGLQIRATCYCSDNWPLGAVWAADSTRCLNLRTRFFLMDRTKSAGHHSNYKKKGGETGWHGVRLGERERVKVRK